MKYWFMEVETREGERSGNSKSVHEAEEFDPNAYVSDFFGDDGEELEEGVYEFDCGCCVASVGRCVEITKGEYETLKKFM